jgi:3'-phosphoadenosine 5'-phosphosulfate sulfotransferase (PAPS reductase)/FAD synthetase
MSIIIRDDAGVAHVVGLSGGDDSTILSILLNEKEPRPYNYLCTPTGNELPEMFEHWRTLGDLLGRKIIPIMHRTGLFGVIREEKMIPNFRSRFCTRILKIEPYREFLRAEAARGPIVSYIGLRADEPGRAGGAYDDIDGVTLRFPLREWGFTDPMVLAELARRGIKIPYRTDCAVCYHQRIGEWYLLWLRHPDFYAQGEAIEEEQGHTFRTPGRDTWPVSLRDLRLAFETGNVPKASLDRMNRERMESGGCRVCSL